MTPSSSSVSCGVSTAVGSSRMSRSTLRESALRISTRCWVPTGRSSTSASGSTAGRAWPTGLRTISRALSRSSIAPPLRRLVSEHHVLGHRHDRHELEVLVHHADAARDGVARVLDGGGVALDRHRPRVRGDEAEDLVDQGGLAGPVLTEQCDDLAAPHVHRDVAVGPHRAEALGQPGEVEQHLSDVALPETRLLRRELEDGIRGDDGLEVLGRGVGGDRCGGVLGGAHHWSPLTYGCPTAPGARTRPAAMARTTIVTTKGRVPVSCGGMSMTWSGLQLAGRGGHEAEEERRCQRPQGSPRAEDHDGQGEEASSGAHAAFEGARGSPSTRRRRPAGERRRRG
jgi:hypothetical protein